MEKCISVLDRDKSIIVCYSKTRVIDRNGKPIEDERLAHSFDARIDTMSSSPSVRLYNVIGVDYLCIQLYGVMRADMLRKTRVFKGYYSCDRNILAELALLGKISEFPDYLFFHRIYPEALGGAIYSGRTLQELYLLDPGTDWNSRFSAFKVYLNYFGSVTRASIPFGEQIMCYLQLQRIILGKIAARIRRSLSR